METFNASLRAIGDVRALPATLALEDGQLSIAAGDADIGTWAIKEIEFEQIPLGYRMAVEGDQIIIELQDIAAFSEALEKGRKHRIRGLKRKTSAKKTKSASVVETPVAPARPPAQTRSREVALPPATQPSTPRRRSAREDRGLIAFVDRTIVKAEKRFGPYLPNWVFTRFMFGMVALTLILMVVLPGLVSVVLLLGGLLLVLFGAVVYTDPMLASRLLPGRTGPQHALLFGVLTLMVGVLLGVIAR